MKFPGGSDIKHPPASEGVTVPIPGLGKSLRGGNDNPL